MSLNDHFAEADALPGNTSLRPDRIHCRLRKEPGVRLEVRHRWLLGSEFVVLADVAGGEIEAELLIPRRLVPEVAQSLRGLHRYMGAPPVHIPGQLRLF